MAGERLARILGLLSGGGVSNVAPADLCAVGHGVTDTTGAGIMLVVGDALQGSLCSTDEVSRSLEDLQYTLGEGPCIDASRHDRPVLEPDLVAPTRPRWPAFTPPAVDTGARAIFGFPLQVGTVRLGALNLYRDRPGPLSQDAHADALVVAGVIGQALLVMQSRTEEGTVPAQLEAGANLRYVVHQAAGVASVQMGVPLPEALARLRAHAYAADRPLDEVAEAVVGRRLRFDPEGDARAT